MEKLKCAIVGCGGIAQVHAAVLNELETAELTAFADIRPERARALADKYGGNAYASLDELLENEKIDVLHICTPHYLHVPMAKAAAERGIHVFSEKPPVINREQWAELQSLKDKVRVGVCFQNRFNDSVLFIKDLLNSGKTGKLLGGRAFVTWHRDAPYYTDSGWRGSLETEGGGVLINQSIHTMDLLVQFFGKPTGVDATMTNHHLKSVIEVEDMFEALIDFDGRPAVFFATTANFNDSPVLVGLNCEKCLIRMEEKDVTVHWGEGEVERYHFEPKDAAHGKAYWGNSHGVCIREFYDCVLTGRRFINDLDGIADTAELMLSAYESARSNVKCQM